MGDRPRNDYRYEYIEQLRIDVLEAFHHFAPKGITLKPNKTRDSKGYYVLHELLEDKCDKNISPSALVDFFTKKGFLNEKNQWVLSFELYTIDAFTELVNQYKKAISNNDPIISDVNSALKSILNELYLRNKILSTVESTITYEENGNGTLSSTVFMQALSDIACNRIQCWADTPIKVTSLEAFDTLSKKKLFLYPYETTENSYFAFVLFPKLIQKNTNYSYSYSMYIQGYCSDLIKNKFDTAERLIMPNKYKSIIEYHRFPDTDFFKNLVITIKGHPNSRLIGKVLKPILKDGFKIYKLDFGRVKNINLPIIVEYAIG